MIPYPSDRKKGPLYAISKMISRKYGVEYEIAREIVKDVFSVAVDILDEERQLRISGFGTFDVKKVPIKASNLPNRPPQQKFLPRITFRASDKLRKRIKI